MVRRDDRMVEVELVTDLLEDASEAAAGGDEHDDRPDGAPPWWRSRFGLGMAGGLAVTLVGLTFGSAYVERAEIRLDDAGVAAFAGVDGVGPSLREPPTERWRMTASAGAIVGGVVLARAWVDGTERTLARDAHTGQTRWIAPDDLDASGGLSCADELPDGRLLCLARGVAGESAANTDARLGGTPDRLVVLDAVDAAVEKELVLDEGVVGWDVVGEDLVVATRTGQVIVVARLRGLDGEALWSSPFAVPVEVRSREIDLRVSDGLVVLSGRMAAVLDGADGSVLGTWEGTGRGRVPVQVLTSSVGFAVWPSPAEGTWYNRAGQAGSRLEGAPLDARVTDGSDPQVLLVQDAGTLRAIDVHRGVLWERPAVQALPLRLDGLAVVVHDGVLRTVDIRSGAELWSATPGLGAVLTPLVTDGLRVLVPGYEVSSGRSVAAHDLRDGSVLWTTPLPPQVSSVSVGGGLLVGFGNEIAVFD